MTDSTPTDEQLKDFHEASWKGDLHALAEFLKQFGGAWIDSKGPSGKTALIWAAQYGHDDVVNFLLDSGAAIDEKSAEQPFPHLMTALMCAASCGKEDTVSLLLSRGADAAVQSALGWTPLHYAAHNGDAGTINTLTRNGADPNAPDKGGMTALILASGRRNSRTDAPEAVKALLAAGAGADAQDNNGITALMEAAMRGHVESARVLLAAGADPNLTDRNGNNARAWAQKQRKPSIEAAIVQWEKQREAQALAAEIAGFSPALKRAIPAPRPLKPPRP
jgi:ankyrin repeat protein